MSYVSQEYRFANREDLREATVWFREYNIKNWYYVPRFIPVSSANIESAYYIVAKFNETENDKMIMAEFKFR